MVLKELATLLNPGKDGTPDVRTTEADIQKGLHHEGIPGEYSADLHNLLNELLTVDPE